MPTVQEQYEDCKIAISKADAGDLRSFYESRCVATISGIVATSVFALHYLDGTFEGADEQQKYDAKIRDELMGQLEARFCAYKQFNKTEFMEVQIAKHFVGTIDGWRKNPKLLTVPLDGVLNAKSALVMVGTLGRNCTEKK